MQLAFVAGAGLLLAGCGRFEFDRTTTGDAALGDAIVDARPIDALPLSCVADDFTTLDMTRWNPYMMGPSLQVTGGQLVITPPASTNGYAGLDAMPINFTSGTMSIEVPQVVGQPNVENYILLFVTNQNFYAIGYDGGRIQYYRREATVDTASTELYNPTDQRFWVMTHNAPTNEMVFSAGPSLAAVTERYRLPITVPITNIQVEIAGGSYAGGSAAPGQAKFDNFQLCLP